MEEKKDLNYVEVNRALWNKRTKVHVDSDFYDNDSFVQGRSSLNSIELDLLGDVAGKRILHLQCHFGQDSISLGRLGAKVTGVDLSDESIKKARELNESVGESCEFVCCDLYELPKHLDKKFDIVYTSYGTIGWLPDLNKWASLISNFLVKGGRFVFVEFHPVVWMFDNDFTSIEYRYFNSGPIVETEIGTYTDRKASINKEYVGWNHGISEVLNNLITNGFRINLLNEYDYSPYNCFNNTEEIGGNRFRIKHLQDKIPMVYAIEAIKE